MNVLCLCENGEVRSKHLAVYLAKKGYETQYAGVSSAASNPLTQEHVSWADKIVTVSPKVTRLLGDRAALSHELNVEFTLFGDMFCEIEAQADELLEMWSH